MNKRESKKQVGRPSCPNPNCEASHVVRTGSHRGRQRYYCRSCKTYFGETQGTPMYGLKTPAAEVAQALLQALRLPCADGVRRYHHRSPAMALGLTDHLWSFQELLTS